MGFTSLHHAVLYGHPELIDILVAFGADLERGERVYGFKPIHLLNKCRQKSECLQKLLDHGVDIHSKDFMGNTLLLRMVCTSPNDEQFLRKLLMLGFDPHEVNVFGNNCLHCLAEASFVVRPEVIADIFLQYGTDINGKNIMFDTPLHIAFERRNLKLVEFLLQEGADINLVNRIGNTPFQNVYSREVPLILVFKLYVAFMKHFILMEKRDEPINPILTKLIAMDFNLRRIYHFFNDKLQRLKKKEVCQMFHTTYYDILCQSDKQVAIYLRNAVFSKYISGQLEHLNSIFSSEIKHRYRKVMISVRKQEDSIMVLSRIVNHRLPYDCVEKIASYLSPKDLKGWNKNDLIDINIPVRIQNNKKRRCKKSRQLP
ncbi:ankyrin repeat and SOCS box protein 6-like isoform X2 [Harmonia axyridis]|nr:ankyrin repeat and SOCS box protein 6-like isoform X2 [Harmonia axyridis]